MSAFPVELIEDIEAGSEKFESDETKSITTIHSASQAPVISRRPNPLNSHKKMMNLALEEAGYWCFGVKAIEVWIYTDDGRLENSPGGSWIDQTYFAYDDPKVSSALNRLYDPSNPDYEDLQTLSYAPGEGLPGALWAETSGNLSSTYQSLRSSKVVTNPYDQPSNTNQDKIHWRDVLGLAIDPDQPYNPRLQLLAKAGFLKAAAVPFSIRDVQGIVIYMARGSVNEEKLCHRTNEQYMTLVAESIGAIQALFKPRRDAAETKKTHTQQIFRRAIRKISMVRAFRNDDEPPQDTRDSRGTQKYMKKKPSSVKNLMGAFDKKVAIPSKKFFYQWTKKMRGANIQPPPPLPNSTSLFVLLSAFITCFTMLAIHASMKDIFDIDSNFITMQLASVTVMVYTLTASPAAQPRSILLGRILAMLVGMTFAYIRIPDGMSPEEFSSTYLYWTRVAASIAVTAALMGKLGIAHPPGGSLSVLFGRHPFHDLNGLKSAGFLITHDVIFICIVSMLNNLNASRSYPTYWGYLPNKISVYIRGKVKR